jgi:hypothetical protein
MYPTVYEVDRREQRDFFRLSRLHNSIIGIRHGIEKRRTSEIDRLVVEASESSESADEDALSQLSSSSAGKGLLLVLGECHPEDLLPAGFVPVRIQPWAAPTR